MAPERDWSWLRRIVARLQCQAKPVRTKRARIVAAGELHAFGLELMAQAEAVPAMDGVRQALGYRDGLMIALLAARPLRRRNFCAIAIGRHLVRQGAGYRVCFAAAETKTGQPMDQPFPVALVPHLERYLAHHRPVLCSLAARYPKGGGARPAGSCLWISRTGTALSEEAFYKTLRQRTTARFGHAVNPHLFRDCAATSIATDDPEHVLITRSLLGHTAMRTSERHYNHAQALVATRRYHERIATLRRAAAEPPPLCGAAPNTAAREKSSRLRRAIEGSGKRLLDR